MGIKSRRLKANFPLFEGHRLEFVAAIALRHISTLFASDEPGEADHVCPDQCEPGQCRRELDPHLRSPGGARHGGRRGWMGDLFFTNLYGVGATRSYLGL